MDHHIRSASKDDAPFIAWVMQTAARSHLEVGVWDLAFPGEDAGRLEALAALASTEQEHLCHWKRFRLLEIDGRPAAGLSGYENAAHGMATLGPAMMEACSSLGYSQEEIETVASSIAPFASTQYPSPDGIWIVEWVATKPEYRGRGLIHHLLMDILEIGRHEGFTRAQIGYLLGNTPARGAYTKAGFEWIDEWCHPDFEAAFGTEGAARMQRDV